MANECNAPERKFDPYKFGSLVTLVIGQRSVNDFCKASGLSRSFVSRSSNNRLNARPTMRTLFKILSADEKGTVTLNQLLDAAGYEPMEEIPVVIQTPQPNSIVIISDDIEEICTKLTIASESEDKYPVVILAKYLDTCVLLREIIKHYSIDIQIALLLD